MIDNIDGEDLCAKVVYEKIEENIARDKRVDDQLRAMDWTPIHFWSKDALKDTDSCISDIISFIIENEHMDDIVEISVEE